MDIVILRKILYIVFLVIFLQLIPSDVYAVSCCVNNGGEYACDFAKGVLYCRDGTISKDCTCKKATPTPSPSPKPTPLPTLPSCVPNSAYDKTIKSCKCNSGYVVENNSCISYRDYCWHNFGSNTAYNSEKDSCVCASGYLWNEESKSCNTYNKTCQLKLGEKSYYNSGDDTCNCFEGYYIENCKCVLIPSPVISPEKIETKVAANSESESIPTPPQELKVISTPKPTEEQNIIIKDGGDELFTTDSKPQKNIILRAIEGVWAFITNIF